MPRGPYSFDNEARRYRDASGLSIPPGDIRAVNVETIASARSAIDQLSDDLVQGKIEIADWQMGMEQHVKKTHTMAAILGAGGRANTTGRDFLAAARNIRFQYQHLRNFALELENGLPLDGTFLARAAMYGASGRVSYEEVSRYRSREAGYDQERRSLGSGKSCNDCIGYADRGWVPAGTLPLPTQHCACHSNCLCMLEHRRMSSVPPAPPPNAIPRFGPSQAKVQPMIGSGQTNEEVLGFAEKLLGRKTSIEELASLAGAPDDARVLIEGYEDFGNPVVNMKVEGSGYNMLRVLKRVQEGDPGAGRPYLYNDYFYIDDKSKQGQGMGRRVFGRQVEAGTKAGIERISTVAAKGPEMNGYAVWPRFGYDGPLKEAFRVDLPSPLKDAEKVSDLMRTPEGRDWWDANGSTMNMEFDMTPGSQSRRIWENYLERKRASGVDLINRSHLKAMTDSNLSRSERETPDFDDDDLRTAEEVWNRLRVPQRQRGQNRPPGPAEGMKDKPMDAERLLKQLDSERCHRRNRTAALRDRVEAVPVDLKRGLYGDEAPRAGALLSQRRGKLPASEAQAVSWINSQVDAELTPEDLWLHTLEAGNSNFIADRFAFLAPSTLKNIANDASSRGISFMNSHRTGGLSTPAEAPYGQAFAGRFESWKLADGKTFNRTLLSVYMLRNHQPNGPGGINTDDFHRGIEGGTLRDVSIGISTPDDGSGAILCDVCGQNLMNSDCPHIPGTHVGMTDKERELQESRGVPGGAASYTYEGLTAGEVSAVYNGAVPGAGFSKARRLARQGKLSQAEIKEAKRAYVKLARSEDWSFVDPSKKGKQVMGRTLGDWLRSALGGREPDDVDLAEIGIEDEAPTQAANLAPKAPDPKPPNPPANNKEFSQVDLNQLAEREKALAERERVLAEREKQAQEFVLTERRKKAEAFTIQAVRDGRATPAQAESLQRTYLELANLDAADNGQRAEDYALSILARPDNRLQQEQVSHNGQALSPADWKPLANDRDAEPKAPKTLTAERRKELLSRTPLGKQAIQAQASPGGGNFGIFQVDANGRPILPSRG